MKLLLKGEFPILDVKLYVGNRTVPYYNLQVTDPVQAASTVQFECADEFEDYTPIHLQGSINPFGGLILKGTETADGYSYEGMDFNRLLFSDVSGAYDKQSASAIMKDILGRWNSDGVLWQGMGINDAGVQETGKLIGSRIWQNESVYNICHQLANIAGWEFSMNTDGIAVFKPQPANDEGYVFYNPSVSDYSLVKDVNDIVTEVKVMGKDDTYLGRYCDSALIAKYGYIQEYITADYLSTAAEGVAAAKAEVAAKQKLLFSGSLKTDILPKMKSGMWLVFVPPNYSKKGIAQYYSQQVTTTINENTVEQQIDLLNTIPDPPSSWIYTDPTSGSPTPASVIQTLSLINSGISQVTGAGTQKTGHDYAANGSKLVWGKWYKSTVVNRCPHCGKATLVWIQGSSHQHYCNNWTWGAAEGMFKCCTKLGGCDADYSIAGNEDVVSGGKKLTLLSGPTLTSAPIPFASAVTPKSTSDDPIYKLAHQLGNPRAIVRWVRDNIKWIYYMDGKYTPKQVLSLRKANCWDQTNLTIALLNSIGYKAWKVCHLRCGGYSHCNGRVVINGKTWTFDTCCSKLNQLT